MCAINPKRQSRFTFSVYTAIEMTEEEFRGLVVSKMLQAEYELNLDARLRWHVRESEDAK